MTDTVNFTSALRLPAVSSIAVGPEEMCLPGYGSRIVLARELDWKKVAVSLFDMRGKLIGRMPPGIARVIVRPGEAEGIVIAKVNIVK